MNIGEVNNLGKEFLYLIKYADDQVENLTSRENQQLEIC